MVYDLYFRCQELEAEMQKLRAECEALRTRTGMQTDGAAPMTSSVAKVVQPTATVSSVPVCGPSMLRENQTVFSLLNFKFYFSYRYSSVRYSRASNSADCHYTDTAISIKGKCLQFGACYKVCTIFHVYFYQVTVNWNGLIIVYLIPYEN